MSPALRHFARWPALDVRQGSKGVAGVRAVDIHCRLPFECPTLAAVLLKTCSIASGDPEFVKQPPNEQQRAGM